jgi:hypothetical protein
MAPAALLGAGAPAFIEVRIGAVHPEHPAWAEPVVAHFRRTSAGWELVGLRRQP